MWPIEQLYIELGVILHWEKIIKIVLDWIMSILKHVGKKSISNHKATFFNKNITLTASEALSYYKRIGAIYLYVIQGQN